MLISQFDTLKVITAWGSTFQVLKDYESQARLMYPAKLYTIERKTFHNLNSFKKFIFNRPNLKKIQEAIFLAEESNDTVERKANS